MRFTTLALSTCLPLLLVGCTGARPDITASEFQLIAGAMTEDEVRTVLGEPTQVEVTNHMAGSPRQYKTTIWTYRCARVVVWVEFYAGKVIRKSEEGLGVGDQEYDWWVR